MLPHPNLGAMEANGTTFAWMEAKAPFKGPFCDQFQSMMELQMRTSIVKQTLDPNDQIVRIGLKADRRKRSNDFSKSLMYIKKRVGDSGDP